MKLIDAARKFLQAKSAKTQAFFDKEHELRTKLTELDAKKSAIISEYDPSKPFDPKAIDKIDGQIDAIKKELAILTETRKLTPEYDVAESVKYIDDVKKEVSAFMADKIKAEEEARAKIAEAKQAFLAAQAEHFKIVNGARLFAADTNETLASLNFGIRQQIDSLRIKAQQIDREIYGLSSGTTYKVVNGSQSVIDARYAELSEVRREIQRLEGYAETVNVGIPQLNNYRNGNGQTIYFVHDLEQMNAANKGILPE